MLRTLVPLLACPVCVASLTLESKLASDDLAIADGTLICGGCGARYPVEQGIPRLLPPDLLEAQRDEIEARDAQVEQYDANGFLNVFGRFEMPLTLKRLAPQTSDRLLEGGCGTGRMTRELAGRVREVVAIDFSFASLLANQAKLAAAGIGNVHLIQADLCRLPLRSELFERVLSCQVLEHVPSDAARQKAAESLTRVAADGGRVVVSAYQYSPLMGAKEGRHDGGIPFFRFTRAEFMDLLSRHLRVLSVTGSLFYIYLAECKKVRRAPAAQKP